MQELEKRKLRNRQNLTLALLLLGYMGYYFCRANFSVIKPLLLEDKALGVDKAMLGVMIAAGTLLYGFGKIVSGALSDIYGGKRLFVGAMLASVLATLWFGLAGGFVTILLAWAVNRSVQSGGWVALVKLASRWFAYEQYGKIMGVVSLSFLFGDSIARVTLGWLVKHGADWREVNFAAAGILAIIALICFLLLKERPEALGLPTPGVNPENVYASAGDDVKPSFWSLAAPLLKSRAFWTILILSFGLTIIRETYNEWSSTMLKESAGLTSGEAAQWSAIFPFAGGVSCLAAGFAGSSNRARKSIIFWALLALTFIFVSTLFLPLKQDYRLSLVVIGLIGLLLMGPYSFLAGALAMDFGGSKGAATASGVIDSAGYLGGALAGYAVGLASQDLGWGAVIWLMLGVSALSTAAAWAFMAKR